MSQLGNGNIRVRIVPPLVGSAGGVVAVGAAVGTAVGATVGRGAVVAVGSSSPPQAATISVVTTTSTPTPQNLFSALFLMAEPSLAYWWREDNTTLIQCQCAGRPLLSVRPWVRFRSGERRSILKDLSLFGF
ncbi:MAG: hypothetical protein IIC82_08840 [Chloroflexi bacterium]|nr:hypothetical protein [Chloroflexota bacterium]